VVLDACHSGNGQAFRAKKTIWTDTEIPSAERDWLATDLKATNKKTICFVHQRLDPAKNYTIKSAPAVRKILEDSGKVLAVFQGHAHVNNLAVINGIRYWTLSAMVDGPVAYSILEIKADNSIHLTGFRGHKSYDAAQ
jgi:alkaline phosphatase